MIASCYLLNKSLTFLAFLDISSILPRLNLLLKGTVTARPRMCLSTAFVTYLCCAFWAFTCLFIGVGAHNNRTFGVGTPLEQRTFLYFEIPEEKTVLIKGSEVGKILDDIRLQRDATMRT